jgi:hypothetical protein
LQFESIIFKVYSINFLKIIDNYVAIYIDNFILTIIKYPTQMNKSLTLIALAALIAGAVYFTN